MSISTTGADVISITNQSQVHTGQWYAAVTAMDETAYSFSVSYGSTTNLVDCQAFTFAAGAQGQVRATLTVPARCATTRATRRCQSV